MPILKQNRLIPLMAIVALVVVAFIFWRVARDGESSVPAGKPLDAVPAATEAVDTSRGGFLSAAKNTKTGKPADADTPTETIRTLTAEVATMRNDMQQLADANRQLHAQQAQTRLDKDQLKTEIKAELQSNPAAGAAPAANTPPSAPPAGAGEAVTPGLAGLVGRLPSGFGFESTGQDAVSGAGTEVGALPRPSSRVIPPRGVSIGKGPAGQATYTRAPVASAQSAKAGGADTLSAAPLGEPGALAENRPKHETPKGVKALKKDAPFYTIPENATLLGATALTAIVGRIPVDGRVHDPMQFKLLLGPQNLAANGYYLPRDLAGVVVSGIAIGDMNLSCSEGIVQSLTFVFNDGAIRTVSMRNNGSISSAAGILGGQGAGQQSGLVQTPKLGYLSDSHGNPCIAGEFKTNAPEYLASVVGLKTLSLAGKAAALAQTTTTSSAGVFGASNSSTVTGNRGRFILGEAASGATDEVTSWITRRMSNSFDAVVTVAGADVVVHIDRPIEIDKTADARYLDYGRDDTARNALDQGSRHGFD